MKKTFLLTLLLALWINWTTFAEERTLELGVSPVNNPLKGLVPYARPFPDRFPHSMEFNYLGLARLVVGYEKYNWQPLEEVLDDIASRGNQAVIRIYMEYPGKVDGIPEYLVKEGLTVHEYLNTNTEPFPAITVSTPDYADPKLRKMLQQFIAAFGAQFDGDPRLGFITAGLLGTWGEWHTYPRNDLWASKETQSEVMDAYEKAFSKTPVLLRYPAGESSYDKASNSNRRFGYHDDSLCWGTLDTGKEEDNWFFVPALKSAGKDAVEKWKEQPIGGEIRPEVWGKIFDDQCDIPQAQPFEACASQLHLSWTMDTGMFREVPSKTRLKNAQYQVSKLGYEFYIDRVDLPRSFSGSSLHVSIHVNNQGIAPLYHPWPIELAAIDKEKRIVKRWGTSWELRGLQPAENKTMQAQLDVTGIDSGDHTLLLRIVNPLSKGKPVQFANADWNSKLEGWLTLGDWRR